ncbi:hypothetical protein AAG906_031309 [Vitis piasezkii]
MTHQHKLPPLENGFNQSKPITINGLPSSCYCSDQSRIFQNANDPITSIIFQDYDLSIMIFHSPYLVDIEIEEIGTAGWVGSSLRPLSRRDLPEVELIVEDTSKFEDTTSSNPKPTQDDNSDLYKLKALKYGNSLMNIVKLKEALPYYEKVMDNELHGLATLQWSTCQDSLSRGYGESSWPVTNMQRLQTHPNALVSKKARQLMFGFQEFFKAFIEDKAGYSLKDNEVEVEVEPGQALPCIIFLVSPILLCSSLLYNWEHR